MAKNIQPHHGNALVAIRDWTKAWKDAAFRAVTGEGREDAFSNNGTRVLSRVYFSAQFRREARHLSYFLTLAIPAAFLRASQTFWYPLHRLSISSMNLFRRFPPLLMEILGSHSHMLKLKSTSNRLRQTLVEEDPLNDIINSHSVIQVRPRFPICIIKLISP